MSSSKISNLLNDSDDSWFESSTSKRKVRPSSPSAKNSKPAKRVALSQKETEKISQSQNPENTEQLFNCPLCKKSCKNAVHRISHLKQCGKKRKIPLSELQQVLGGAFNKNQFKTTNKASKESITTQENLSLAAAISLSLNETHRKPEVIVDKTVYDSQKATLETFGFTSTSSAVGFGRKKRKTKRVSVLKSRSEEDRRRLISEKCALILLDSDQFSANNSLTQMAGKEMPKLWEMAGSSENSNPCWFVQLLEKKENKVPSTIDAQRSGLEGLSDDWDKLVGNSKLSDATISTIDGSVPVHKIIFQVRCPQLNLDSFLSTKVDLPTNAFLAILRYLYSGTLGTIEDSIIDKCKLFASDILHKTDLVELLNRRIPPQNCYTEDADTVPALNLETETSFNSSSNIWQENVKETEKDALKRKVTEVITLSSDDDSDTHDEATPKSQSLLQTHWKKRKELVVVSEKLEFFYCENEVEVSTSKDIMDSPTPSLIGSLKSEGEQDYVDIFDEDDIFNPGKSAPSPDLF